MNEKFIMEKLASFMAAEELITPEEKVRLLKAITGNQK